MYQIYTIKCLCLASLPPTRLEAYSLAKPLLTPSIFIQDPDKVLRQKRALFAVRQVKFRKSHVPRQKAIHTKVFIENDR